MSSIEFGERARKAAEKIAIDSGNTAEEDIKAEVIGLMTAWIGMLQYNPDDPYVENRIKEALDA